MESDRMDSASSEVPREIPLHLLKEITDDFSEELELGTGAYGKVYMGVHKNGMKIAVKMLHDMPGLEEEQFENEFNNLARLKHQNIVQLVGYCFEIQKIYVDFRGRLVLADKMYRLLCFEYIQNGNLNNYISDEYHGLDWHTRYAIIKGICDGLKYLHEELKPPIYHLDLKPANILLDKNMVPKIADFGMSRFFGEEQTQITRSCVGTQGYVPPEYIEHNVISKEFDIFSLGVIIIKIVTGHKGYSESADISPQQFLDLVHERWKNRLQASPMYRHESSSKQVKRCIEIALSCVVVDRKKRPSIGHIVNKLNETETNQAREEMVALLAAGAAACAANPTSEDPAVRTPAELMNREEAADVAKSQFLATVSHEMITPMNGIVGMLQMLMDTDLDTAQQEYVQTAQVCGKALVSLINEVLDQANIESGKLELEAVPFDIRSVCDDILSLFCARVQEKGLEMAVYVSDQVPQTLVGDPDRIRQIIINLVANSIKNTQRGHIYLTVHAVEEVMSFLEVETGARYKSTLSGYPVASRRRSWENFGIFNRELHSSEMSFALAASDSISLIISVEDTGVGIPFETQSRVFTPSMQVGPSIDGGLSIGLSISKSLVGLMKGEIGFASKPRVGSTFTFTAVLTRARAGVCENKSSYFEDINALVVDHRQVRAKVTKYHLQRLGVQTELTKDLDQYISKVNSGSRIPKLVLIDKETWLKESHSMPLSVRKLGNNDQPAHPKLFLLENCTSSIESSSHISREYNLNVIMKPLRASMLEVSLRRALGSVDKVHCKNGVGGHSTLGSLLHKKQIIVVDDNIVNLKVLAGALKKYGAEITCVDSGKKAITLLKPPHKFHACFMDTQMPELDGFEATRRIRVMERDLNERIERGEVPPECANIWRWRTPILAMTTDVIQATHEDYLRSEMDGYVSKPFVEEQLCRQLARFYQCHGPDE